MCKHTKKTSAARQSKKKKDWKKLNKKLEMLICIFQSLVLDGANVLYRKGFDKKQFIKITIKKKPRRNNFLGAFSFNLC